MLPFERVLPLPLPKEVLGKVYSFDATHREDYVLVMKELRSNYINAKYILEYDGLIVYWDHSGSSNWYWYWKDQWWW